MLVILFRSRLTEAAGADYARMDEELEAIARAAPGSVERRSYAAEEGERLTVVRWRDAETLRAWREHPRHREAQRTGRARWYREYHIEVAELVRESGFTREEAAPPPT